MLFQVLGFFLAHWSLSQGKGEWDLTAPGPGTKSPSWFLCGVRAPDDQWGLGLDSGWWIVLGCSWVKKVYVCHIVKGPQIFLTIPKLWKVPPGYYQVFHSFPPQLHHQVPVNRCNFFRVFGAFGKKHDLTPALELHVRDPVGFQMEEMGYPLVI